MMQEIAVLDGFDLRLLAALQANAAATNAVLADAVGLSASQVSRRRQALEEAGIITAYRAILAPEKIGLSLTAFIHVTLKSHSPANARRFRDLVRHTPHILEAHAMTGTADYVLKATARDLKEFAALINDVLLVHDSIERVRSEVVLETLKAESLLPLPAAR
ncbi:MAG: Lrp/AsnC family transcriptional regulator [Beijerinckiaceae bacterium]